AAFTPAITFNNGLGDDGQIYDQMVRALRDHAAIQPAPPWVYRLAPAWIVAATGVDTRLGFILLNVASVIASAPLFVLFLRRYAPRSRSSGSDCCHRSRRCRCTRIGSRHTAST